MAKASEIWYRAWFAKSNNKITPKDKSGRSFRLGSFKNLGFSFNIYAMAENKDFKFGAQFWFAN